jgi:hypothetical protein
MSKTHKKLINISISYENYNTLRELGKTKDSFNDVLSRILKKVEHHDGNGVRSHPSCVTIPDPKKEEVTHV